jgi:hypothetical protein
MRLSMHPRCGLGFHLRVLAEMCCDEKSLERAPATVSFNICVYRRSFPISASASKSTHPFTRLSHIKIIDPSLLAPNNQPCLWAVISLPHPHPIIMPPKGASTAIQPIRLQSVSRLRIRHPDKAEANPCLGPMSAMLSTEAPIHVQLQSDTYFLTDCWGSSSQSSGGCAHLEKALRECMDVPRPAKGSKSSINYHLGRLFPQIRGPRKRKGSIG